MVTTERPQILHDSQIKEFFGDLFFIMVIAALFPIFLLLGIVSAISGKSLIGEEI